jgi:dimeric dUTPase (all-alpha-NTP-PPase superfamily)
MVKRKTKKCAICGKKITGDRFVLKIVCYAAFDGLEIRPEDLSRDIKKQIRDELRKIKKLSKKRLQDDIAKWWKFSICPACARKYRRNPLRGVSSK